MYLCRIWWVSFVANCDLLLLSSTGKGLQRDVFYLGWPMAPSYMSPNAGGRGELRGLNQWVQLYMYIGAPINFGYLTPYLTYVCRRKKNIIFCIGSPVFVMTGLHIFTPKFAFIYWFQNLLGSNFDCCSLRGANFAWLIPVQQTFMILITDELHYWLDIIWASIVSTFTNFLSFWCRFHNTVSVVKHCYITIILFLNCSVYNTYFSIEK